MNQTDVIQLLGNAGFGTVVVFLLVHLFKTFIPEQLKAAKEDRDSFRADLRVQRDAFENEMQRERESHERVVGTLAQSVDNLADRIQCRARFNEPRDPT